MCYVALTLLFDYIIKILHAHCPTSKNLLFLLLIPRICAYRKNILWFPKAGLLRHWKEA